MKLLEGFIEYTNEISGISAILTHIKLKYL